MDISYKQFRRSVLETAAPTMEEYGYHVVGEEEKDPQNAIVDFRKHLHPDISCIVSFQLMLSHIPAVRDFQVFLSRKRADNSGDGKDEFVYLGMSLRNVLKGVFNIDISAKRLFEWAFVDEETLVESLIQATSYVALNGILWIEDPKSNMKWTRLPK